MAVRRTSALFGRWFGDSLKFSCTQCGKCCKGRTNVFVNEAEAVAIAEFLDIPKFKFFQMFTEERLTPDGWATTLKSKPTTSECIFLKEKACLVYEHRPTGCRTYPFWPQILMGTAEWKAEASRCEGIVIEPSVGSIGGVDAAHHPREEIGDSSIKPAAAIIHNLILFEVHKRGLGPNWTFDDASEYLTETKDNVTVQDFEDEFFLSHYSNIVFEDLDGGVRIVDSTYPDPNKLRLDDLAESAEGESEAIRLDAPTLVTYRRLEFIRSPGIAQTEIQLESNSFNFSNLMMPVHRFMASCCKVLMKSTKSHDLANGQAQRCRIGLIGAGGCSLAMHLLLLCKENPKKFQPVHIDAVEPSAVVIDVAKKYFGAEFTESQASVDLSSSCLIPHVTDGKSFLEDAATKRSSDFNSGGSFDVLLIDAYEDVESQSKMSSEDAMRRAPPVSLLENPTRLLSSLVSAQHGNGLGGLLVVNILGTEAWMNEVMSRFTTAAEETGCMPPILVRVESESEIELSNFLLLTRARGIYSGLEKNAAGANFSDEKGSLGAIFDYTVEQEAVLHGVEAANKFILTAK